MFLRFNSCIPVQYIERMALVDLNYLKNVGGVNDWLVTLNIDDVFKVQGLSYFAYSVCPRGVVLRCHYAGHFAFSTVVLDANVICRYVDGEVCRRGGSSRAVEGAFKKRLAPYEAQRLSWQACGFIACRYDDR